MLGRAESPDKRLCIPAPRSYTQVLLNSTVLCKGAADRDCWFMAEQMLNMTRM